LDGLLSIVSKVFYVVMILFGYLWRWLWLSGLILVLRILIFDIWIVVCLDVDWYRFCVRGVGCLFVFGRDWIR